ncbi:hypothetical protein GSI_12259 [Ganoderma sinense ZZ0214-1]|uniref:Uncharacterized protein n=1 Tax=Ganoderma sinense ZZ0214-1 TaxID=1077348 RepID=A0A2G8RYA5_9APHY|nr:hypothetical protein GSI_12259 [Ganoderma sinense ZZ0214-1]
METLHLDIINLVFGADGLPTVDEFTVPLAALAASLLIFSNVKNVALSCPAFEVDAKDDDFRALTHSWKGLQKFMLHHSYKAGDAGRIVPTAAVLEIFHDNCPDLRELTLPYLDLNVNIPTLPVDPSSRDVSPHKLAHLDIDRNVQIHDEDMDERNVDMWARHIHSLFPMLEVKEPESSDSREEVIQPTRNWRKVLERIRNITKPLNEEAS